MKKVKNKISPFAIVVLAFLILYTLVLFIPLIWGFIVSLQSSNALEISLFSIKWPPQFSNYGAVFKEMVVSIKVFDNSGAELYTNVYYMEHMLWFTFLYAVVCSFANIGITCITAYITARFDFKICRIVDAIVIVTMILPVVGSMPSELRIIRALGLYDSLWGMMILKANFVTGTTFLMFNATFRSLPKDFAEAAQIDGASNLKVMFGIMMPLAKNMFFTLWLLLFIQFWNDYQTPLLYFPSKPTLSYGLYLFTSDSQSQGSELNHTLAACFLLMIPILVIFLFTSEKLIGNVSMGGLKE